jgi:hypothetical protein
LGLKRIRKYPQLFLSGQKTSKVYREGEYSSGRGFFGWAGVSICTFLSTRLGVIPVVFKLRLNVIFSNLILLETQNLVCLGYVSIVKKKKGGGIMYPNAQSFWKKTENRMFCLVVEFL